MSPPVEDVLQNSTAGHQAPRLKLSMPSPAHLANMQMTPESEQQLDREVVDTMPRRPSYSPVTPVFAGRFSHHEAHHDGGMQTPPVFIDEPEPVAISLEENSDAIALEAALSILQMQKHRAQKDIQQLSKMKKYAKANPESFVAALKAGELSKSAPESIFDFDAGDNSEGDDLDAQNAEGKSGPSEKDIGQFPTSQKIIRCPPVNWAKYHVVGEPLDRIHREQQHRPEPGQPHRDEYGRPPEYRIAAPYRPLIDKPEPGVAHVSRGEKR